MLETLLVASVTLGIALYLQTWVTAREIRRNRDKDGREAIVLTQASHRK
ncbi:hypothetical protein [Phaeobacter sp.]|nr:hypothetical protein [Phaeobacter sp.]